MHSEIPWYVVVFIIATAAGVILQAAILAGMFIALRKTQKKLEQVIDEARVHVMPAIASTRTLIEDLGPKVTAAFNDLSPKITATVDDLGPKIKAMSSNLVEITVLVRGEAENLKSTMDEVVDHTRNQAARVDRMLTGTLNGVEHATTTIQNGVAIPIRKISGWVAGIKAGLEVLGRRAKSRVPPPQDAEGFAYPPPPSPSAVDEVEGEFINPTRVSESDLFV